MTKSKDYLAHRLKGFQKALCRAKLDGYLIEDPINLYYFTGLPLSAGRLIIKKKSAKLFVDGRYIQKCKKDCAIPTSILQEAKSFLSGAMGFDEGIWTVEAYRALRRKCKLVPSKMLLQTYRAVKDVEEIKRIKKSAKCLWKGFLFLKSLLKEGVVEQDLAKHFEIFCLQAGAEKLSFDPIIAFGPSTSMPHYHPGKVKLKKNSITLFDIGVVVDGYASDMTRTLFFGKKDPQLEEIYHIVRKAHKKAAELCKPGTPFNKLDKAARDVITKAGYGEQFMHNTGHGVGLEVHEYPPIRAKVEGVLKPGMVITIEPGIYLAGKGGVRHEDMILITESGHRNLFS